MDGRVPRIGSGLGAFGADRVGPRKEREREEQADFAEEMEQQLHDQHNPDAQPQPGDPEPSARTTAFPDLGPSLGYPTDDESGNSLDLTA